MQKPRKIKTECSPIDLDTYAPALVTWIANKLSRGASALYLEHFGVGIEVWRCLVLLAHGKPLSAQEISQQIGLDKSSVSRSFKRMHAKGLIKLSLDDNDGRLRLASITDKGASLHNSILGLALVRESAVLSNFSQQERKTLLKLLHKLHSNMPLVEEASLEYLAKFNK